MVSIKTKHKCQLQQNVNKTNYIIICKYKCLHNVSSIPTQTLVPNYKTGPQTKDFTMAICQPCQSFLLTNNTTMTLCKDIYEALAKLLLGLTKKGL